MPLFLHEHLHPIPQSFQYPEMFVQYFIALKDIVLTHMPISQNTTLLIIYF